MVTMITIGLNFFGSNDDQMSGDIISTDLTQQQIGLVAS